MKITNLKIHNFSSYHGSHELDFSTNSHLDGYAIFGHEGRGKTSIMRAILWCLYGEVKSSVRSGKKYLNRPLIDLSQIGQKERMDRIAPLISDQAVKRNKFDMYVTLEFSSNGKKYVLKRETKPKPNPRDDKDIKIETHLSVDATAIPPAKIPNVVNRVIPERISRFFFIEMDAIERYADLLFGNNIDSTSIKSDIEAILGFPAIKKSEEDFSRLSKIYQKRIRDLKRDGSDDKELDRDIKTCEEKIAENNKEIKEVGKEISIIKNEIEELETELSKQPLAQELMNRKDDLTKNQIPNQQKEIQRKYDVRKKKLSENAWLCLIQNKIEAKISEYADKREKQNELTREQGTLRVDIARDETRLELKSDEEWFCPVCEEKRASLNLEEREKLTKRLSELRTRQNEIDTQLSELGNPQSVVDSLSAFKNSDIGYVSEISDLEFGIGEDVVRLNSMISDLEEVEKGLSEHDEKLIANMKKEIQNKTKYLGEREALHREVGVILKENEEDLAKLEKLLQVSKIDKKKERNYTLILEMFDWLQIGFSSALSVGRTIAKASVEEIANNTFLGTITESERYSKLTISENWGIEVFSNETGARARLDNPGHKQIVAVSLFDGLRSTSRRNYPTFFDNPGSNISDKVLDRMVTHFWSQKHGQVIMLSHGGGLREKESIEKYGSSLAKAWRLTYRGDGLTSKIEEVDL